MADTEGTERVPDLPCPKCGDADVSIRYCRGEWRPTGSCIGLREHFDRGCRRCGYVWETFDVRGGLCGPMKALSGGAGPATKSSCDGEAEGGRRG